MKLADWITGQVETLQRARHRVLADLVKASGVSRMTIVAVDRGMTLNTYSKALSISNATGGAVTVAELCEANQ